MSLTTYTDLEQGSEQWLEARRGMLTASNIGLLITSRPPAAESVACPECTAVEGEVCKGLRNPHADLKAPHGTRTSQAAALPPVLVTADNDTSRGFTTSLVAERITGHIDPVYVARDMQRGTWDEPIARDFYSEHHAPVSRVGFMVRDFGGFRIGYSPDGLVGDDGLIEIKSRRQKTQVLTVLDDQIPAENMAQLQAGLLVSGREWIDYVSFSGGMALWTKRVHVSPAWFDAILTAARKFEDAATDITKRYTAAVKGLPVTERTPDPFADPAIQIGA